MIARSQPWLGTLVDIRIVSGGVPTTDQRTLRKYTPAADVADVADVAADVDTDTAVNTADAADAAALISGLQPAFAAAFGAIALVQRLMSFHDPDSELSAINRLPVGAALDVDAHTAAVLTLAVALEQASGGVFNVACADRLCASGHLPGTASASASASRPPGYVPPSAVGLPRNVLQVDGAHRVTRLRPGSIDLGGLAKGYAVDLAVAALQHAGVTCACVNAGGDLRAFGPGAFEIVLRDPVQPGVAAATYTLCNQALATSATTFSLRSDAGVPSSALLDGRDGHAILARCSASVVAPSCILADALTKVVIASGDPNHAVLADYAATAFLL